MCSIASRRSRLAKTIRGWSRRSVHDLEAYVEADLNVPAIVELDFDQATEERVIRLVDPAEYKRRPSAPGLKITALALGRDRRLPITNAFRDLR